MFVQIRLCACYLISGDFRVIHLLLFLGGLNLDGFNPRLIKFNNNLSKLYLLMSE
jgi:hypothetical protein